MSEIWISLGWNPKYSSGFLANVFGFQISYWNFSHKHDIYSFIYMIIHMEKTFKAMQCQKCRKYFSKSIPFFLLQYILHALHNYGHQCTWVFLTSSAVSSNVGKESAEKHLYSIQHETFGAIM